MITVIIEQRSESAYAATKAIEYVSGPRGPEGPSAGEGIDPDLVLIYTVARET